MRRLTPGDINAKLKRIERSSRSRKWKRAAKAHLLADVKGWMPQNGHIIELPDGKKVCTKRRFSTFGAAASALADTMASPNGSRRERRVYPCRDCHAFHLTSMEHHHHDRYHWTEEDPQDLEGHREEG